MPWDKEWLCENDSDTISALKELTVFSQGSRHLKSEESTNVNAALGACKRFQESPEKRVRVIFLVGMREGFLKEVASGFSR